MEMAVLYHARICDQSIKFYLPAEIIVDIVSQMNISML